MTLRGVQCLVLEPQRPTGTCLWIHGGGFRVGAPAASARFAVPAAAQSGARIVLPEYALAPEHPFPAALREVAVVYDEARTRWRGPVVVGGDSAGGGLALSLIVAARRSGVPSPAAAVLLSPWCDLTVTAATYETNARTDQLFSLDSAREAVELYLQGWDPLDALVSPVRADLSGFPACLVIASSHEVLLDDARHLVDGLLSRGVEVEAHFVPHVPHVFPVVDPEGPASVAAIDHFARFIRRWLQPQLLHADG